MKLTADQMHDLAMLYVKKTIAPLEHTPRNNPNAVDILYARYVYALELIAAKNDEASD